MFLVWIFTCPSVNKWKKDRNRKHLKAGLNKHLFSRQVTRNRNCTQVLTLTATLCRSEEHHVGRITYFYKDSSIYTYMLSFNRYIGLLKNGHPVNPLKLSRHFTCFVKWSHFNCKHFIQAWITITVWVKHFIAETGCILIANISQKC